MTEESMKYNTGIPISLNNVEKENLSLAISDWAEGNTHLQYAIGSCIDNNIPTHASCAGHHITDSPYLSMLISKQNLGNILNIMDKVSKERNMKIALDLNILKFCEDDTKYESVLTVYSNMFNKNKCFDIIEDAAKSSINLEQASPIVQELWKTHQTIRTCGDKYWKPSNSISYKKTLFSNELESRLYISDNYMEEILSTAGFHTTTDGIGNPVYIRKASIKDLSTILQNISQGVDETFIVDEEDEFYEKETNPHEDFKESLKQNIDVKNISVQEKSNDEKDKEER